MDFTMFRLLEVFKIDHDMSFSDAVDMILSLTSCIILDDLQKHKEFHSKYMTINADKELWVDIKLDNYRRIKQFHDMMNVFSMAQSVRFCISVFFRVFVCLGSLDKTVEHFNKLAEKRKTKLKQNNLEVIQYYKLHMWSKNSSFPQNLFFISNNFHLEKEIMLE